MSDLAEARRFLSVVMPWPARDEPGFVNIHWRHWWVDDSGKRKEGWGGRATRTVDEAINAISWALTLPNVLDIYFCISVQAAAKQKFDKFNRPYYIPVRNQINALKIKLLSMDIDVKPDAYVTIIEAIRALKAFADSLHMPPPDAVVSTGGGLHVYWVYPQALLTHEWKLRAIALATAAEKYGVKFDKCCTIDAARLLRIPGTFNCKQEKRREVKLLGLSEDRLDAVA